MRKIHVTDSDAGLKKSSGAVTWEEQGLAEERYKLKGFIVSHLICVPC